MYQGRFCNIEELTTMNDVELFTMMSEYKDDYEKLVFSESVACSYPKFQQKISEWFSNGRNYQFLVRQNTTDSLVGTMFFYNLCGSRKTVKCSCFFVSKARGTILVMESLTLLLQFARHLLGIDSLRFSVYGENILMHEIARKNGALLLGSNLKTVDYEFSAETIDNLLKKYTPRVTKTT